MEEVKALFPLLLLACANPEAPPIVSIRAECHGQKCYIVAIAPGYHKQVWDGTGEWDQDGLRIKWRHGDTLYAQDSAYANWDFTTAHDADYLLIVAADGGQDSKVFHSTRDSTWATP